jgi:hypothetical protein
MTCYFRYLKGAFKKVGVNVSSENKRVIDRIIHGMVGVKYKNCSATWKAVKARLVEDEDVFLEKLKQSIPDQT